MKYDILIHGIRTKIRNIFWYLTEYEVLKYGIYTEWNLNWMKKKLKWRINMEFYIYYLIITQLKQKKNTI